MRILPLLSLILVTCSTGNPSPSPIPSASMEAEISRVESLLPLCDSYYSRPSCDMGDAMTLTAVMARIHPDKAKAQVMASIAPDGRPFRSPRHLQRFQQGDTSEDVASHSFSRDHIISILFYTVWTKDPEPLSLIWEYATHNDLKVCEGSSAQCLLTPAMLDQIGDVFAYTGKPRPWQTKVPGALSAVTQMVSVPSISSWQLTLAAEHILLKTVTGNLNQAWKMLASQVSKKSPENLFYRYVYLAANDKDVREIEAPLLSTMKSFKVGGKQWFWNDQNPDTATGYDFILLAHLLTKGF